MEMVTESEVTLAVRVSGGKFPGDGLWRSGKFLVEPSRIGRSRDNLQEAV
jgi:hypothetical protein